MARSAKKTVTKKAAKKSVAPPAPKTAAKASTDGLGAIEKALAKGDGAAALSAALEAWRTARAPALADLIDAISSKISGAAITKDSEWTTVANRKDPIDLGRLLPAITELPVSFLPSASIRLAEFPDDPRIASAARAWIVEPPCTSSSAYPFWTKLFDTLVRLGDTRVIAAMQKRVKMPQEASNQPWVKNRPSQFWGKYYAALDKTRAKLEELSPPTVDKAAIAKLEKQAGKLGVVEASAPKAKKEGGPPLPRALAHAQGGRVREAIDAMVEAWRGKRAPVLADLIDRATRLMPSYDLPWPSGKEGHAAWQAAFESDPNAAMPQLVRHINTGGSAAAVEHVASLSTLPDDPRIAMRLVEVTVAFDVSPQKPQYWKPLWETIARTGDARVIPALRTHYNNFEGNYYDHHRSGRRILADFLTSGEASAPNLDADEHKQVNQIAATLDTLEAAVDPRERELIADIIKNWADEGPRLVYADWLAERGNLRGEVIVLECKRAREGALSAAEEKRHKVLVPPYNDNTYMFGPLSDVTSYTAPQWRDRGIPQSLHTDWKTCRLLWRHLIGYPLMACIETIDLAESADPRGRPAAAELAAVMLDPTATRLSKVINVPNDERGLLASELEPLVKPAWRRATADAAGEWARESNAFTRL